MSFECHYHETVIKTFDLVCIHNVSCLCCVLCAQIVPYHEYKMNMFCIKVCVLLAIRYQTNDDRGKKDIKASNNNKYNLFAWILRPIC